MMELRGYTFDFDIFDDSCAEAYEKALTLMRMEGERKVANEGLADNLRRQCRAVFSFFDTLLGEGAHEDIFGTRVNLRDCIDAYTELMDKISEQKAALDERMRTLRGDAPPNRATRRAMQS